MTDTLPCVSRRDLLKAGLSQRGYVMDGGLITLADESKALLANPKVREAYLGEG